MADVDELSLEAEMHEVFVFFDDDRDGKLNTSEFACVSSWRLLQLVVLSRFDGHFWECDVQTLQNSRVRIVRSVFMWFPDALSAQAVRSLGFAPTEDDIAAFERTIRHRYDGMLTEREFENVMTGIVIPRLSKAKDPETEMNEALKVRPDVPWTGQESQMQHEWKVLSG